MISKIWRRFVKADTPSQIRQPVPQVSAADVDRMVRRDFPEYQFDTIFNVLDTYGAELSEPGRARVQLAALKLANGNIDTLRRHIDTAARDYKDVLSWAEYPEYSKRSTVDAHKLSAREREQIIQSDWNQYEAWRRR